MRHRWAEKKFVWLFLSAFLLAGLGSALGASSCFQGRAACGGPFAAPAAEKPAVFGAGCASDCQACSANGDFGGSFQVLKRRSRAAAAPLAKGSPELSAGPAARLARPAFTSFPLPSPVSARRFPALAQLKTIVLMN